MLMYKGYTAEVKLDVALGLLHGRVCNLHDVITFEGKTSEEVELEFQKSVEAYLSFCQEIGQEPEQPAL